MFRDLVSVGLQCEVFSQIVCLYDKAKIPDLIVKTQHDKFNLVDGHVLIPTLNSDMPSIRREMRNDQNLYHGFLRIVLLIYRRYLSFLQHYSHNSLTLACVAARVWKRAWLQYSFILKQFTCASSNLLTHGTSALFEPNVGHIDHFLRNARIPSGEQSRGVLDIVGRIQ